MKPIGHVISSGMTTTLWSLLLVLPGIALAAQEHSATEPWPRARERGAYQAKLARTGQVLWTVEWETAARSSPDGTQLEIFEQGEGQPLRYKEPIRWEKRMTVHLPGGAGGVFLPRSVSGSRWTRDGRLLSRMDVQLDPQRRSIVYRDSGDAGAERAAEFAWSADALPDELLFHWARTLPFEELSAQKRWKECLLLVSATRRFRVRASVRGREEVVTPAGTFSCYRVDLIPQLLGPLKALAPRMSLWCRAEPPHPWVRYQGPVGGPGSPQAVLELVRLEQKS